jgi:acetolactate synthase-1/2/3 large subunit
VGRDAVEAFVAARTAPGQIATLIVPTDMAWSEGGSIAAMPFLPKPPPPTGETVEKAAACSSPACEPRS